MPKPARLRERERERERGKMLLEICPHNFVDNHIPYYTTNIKIQAIFPRIPQPRQKPSTETTCSEPVELLTFPHSGSLRADKMQNRVHRIGIKNSVSFSLRRNPTSLSPPPYRKNKKEIAPNQNRMRGGEARAERRSGNGGILSYPTVF